MEKAMALKKIGIWISVIFLTGCSVGPDYLRPPVQTTTKFKEAPPPGWKVASPQDEFDRGRWWTVFHDPILNRLEEQVNVSNENIISAVAQYQEALANIDIQRAAYYPTLGGSASYTRQKLPASGLIGTGVNNGATGLSPKSNSPFNTYFLGLNASWIPDIWGGVRRAVESSRETAEANAAQIAATRLLMQGTLAQDYFTLRALDADEKLLTDTAAAYRKTLHLIQQRYKAGTAAVTDVMQALAQLKGTEASAIDVGVARAQTEHAIAVLVGKPPAAFGLKASPLPMQITPPSIPLQVPSELLERRPDIAVAERTMAANNALIGVAMAAYFPTLTLAGTAGFQANVLKRLFNPPSAFWSYGTSLTQFLFDGGLRGAKLESARDAYDASLASYRQTVLAAFQNVEDNLAALRILQNESSILKEDVKASRRAYELTLSNYQQGTADYTAVVVAQITLLTAEKNYVDVTGRRMTSAVGLIMSLGGGWNESQIYLDPPSGK